MRRTYPYSFYYSRPSRCAGIRQDTGTSPKGEKAGNALGIGLHRLSGSYGNMLENIALIYWVMSQSKYTKRDAALLLPNRTDVISVSISCDDKREMITDIREIDDLFASLSTVHIKSGESYDDSPMTDKFIKVFFEVSDGLSGCVVYVFEDENGFFIEQPYNGIFSIEEKQYTEIFGTLF